MVNQVFTSTLVLIEHRLLTTEEYSGKHLSIWMTPGTHCSIQWTSVTTNLAEEEAEEKKKRGREESAVEGNDILVIMVQLRRGWGRSCSNYGLTASRHRRREASSPSRTKMATRWVVTSRSAGLLECPRLESAALFSSSIGNAQNRPWQQGRRLGKV